MVDDRKHTEPVRTFFTEREYLDLSRIADREDRKVGEMVRVFVRRSMYGTIGAESQEGQQSNVALGGRE